MTFMRMGYNMIIHDITKHAIVRRFGGCLENIGAYLSGMAISIGTIFLFELFSHRETLIFRQTHSWFFGKSAPTFPLKKTWIFPRPNLGFQEDTKMDLESISH